MSNYDDLTAVEQLLFAVKGMTIEQFKVFCDAAVPSLAEQANQIIIADQCNIFDTLFSLMFTEHASNH